MKDTEKQNPQTYFNEAVTFIKRNAYKTSTVKWEIIEKDFQREIDFAKTTGDIHTVLTKILRLLDDNHSVLIPSDKLSQPSNSKGPEGQQILPTGKELSSGINYLNIPGVMMFDEKFCDTYANTLQTLIRELDGKSHSNLGWIIDFRNNFGGNMWPMIAGLGPLLGNGVLGNFVHNDGSKKEITYADGKAAEDSTVYSKVKNPYELKSKRPSIALLTSNKTASSGEITLVTFLGLENIKTFGETTYGIPTANDQYKLNDGSLLFLTVAATANRFGKVYASVIKPDVHVNIDWDNIASENDSAINVATEWLINK